MYIVKAEANQIERIVDMSIRAFETDVNVGGVKGDCPPGFDSIEWHKQMALEGHLYQWMCAKYKKLKALGRGARDDLNADIIKSFPIAVPSLDEQKKLVDKLKELERIENSFRDEVNTEISLRQIQFSYYRDRLLSFTEAS